ncbi:MAG: flagellar basal body L-ring protein FlgH, partial [Candidatus Eisenbacteria bacterium]|nr:flagellar basal body L-ring protein FlgH [Candidatus Eisenbacteria bacterium]
LSRGLGDVYKRQQQVMLSGSIRTADIPSSNIIYSERIADLQISYKGKKLAPRAGILGRILSMLWP